MENLVITEYEEIVDVANAIRSKTGATESMTLDEMVGNVMGISGNSDAVLYVEQNLTDSEKTQARENIGAISQSQMDSFYNQIESEYVTEIELTNRGYAKQAETISIVKLWENANPSDNFDGQTIATGASNASDYAFVMGVFNVSSSGRKLVNFIPLNWYGEIQWTGNIDSTLATMFFRRTWTFGSSGNFIISGCQTKQSSTTGTNNGYLIPVAIYGIKGVQ